MHRQLIEELWFLSLTKGAEQQVNGPAHPIIADSTSPGQVRDDRVGARAADSLVNWILIRDSRSVCYTRAPPIGRVLPRCACPTGPDRECPPERSATGRRVIADAIALGMVLAATARVVLRGYTPSGEPNRDDL